MHCPFCQTPETRVVDSRITSEGLRVRRRRECLVCKERFSSSETIELSMPMVVKADGTRMMFDISKLRDALLRALSKSRLSFSHAETIAAEIARKARHTEKKEITSRQLGEWALSHLSKVDEVAYLRYASVFNDSDSFKLLLRDYLGGLL